MRRPKQNQTAVISHPKFPEFKVTIRRQGRAELLELQQLFTPYQTEVALKDKDSGELLRDPQTRQPYVHIRQSIPLKVITEALARVVESWTGLEDEEGKPIAYSAQSISILFEEWLDVENPDFDSSKPETVENAKVISFAAHLRTLAEKGATFDSDPLASGSASR